MTQNTLNEEAFARKGIQLLDLFPACGLKGPGADHGFGVSISESEQ